LDDSYTFINFSAAQAGLLNSHEVWMTRQLF